MLKWYADTFKLTEREMTAKSLRRIKWLTFFGALAFPVAVVRIYKLIPDSWQTPVHAIYVLLALCCMCLMLTKFVNRFYARDKYLDEWEKTRKHEAMAFAFQVLIYVLGFFGALFVGASFVSDFTFPPFDFLTMAFFTMGTLGLCIFTMLTYLLATTKPIDSMDELTGELSLDDVI